MPRKRVLFYGRKCLAHKVVRFVLNRFPDYDVVNSKGDWTSADPFTLTGIGAHLYGRGVIDNKGRHNTLSRTQNMSEV